MAPTLVAFLLVASIDLPPDVARFVPVGHEPIALESGDVNGDGRADHLLVTEETKGTVVDDDGYVEHRRALLVLLRAADRTLREAARSDRSVHCRECGGIMGDPFQHVTVEKNRFSVEHYGGSAWRWSNRYTFAYSRRDQAWQLVRVEERSFHVSEPDRVEIRVYRPPRDFGKIDLRDFDPQDFLGKGPK